MLEMLMGSPVILSFSLVVSAPGTKIQNKRYAITPKPVVTKERKIQNRRTQITSRPK